MKKAHIDVIIYKIEAVRFLSTIELLDCLLTTQTLKALDPCHNGPA
jgi:hypothetical protein